MEDSPRWEGPLSTTQNTRRAEAYGSWAMTSPTSRPKGAIPVCSSHRPKSLARCTSHAARYCRAPHRAYSCSTRMARDAAGARVGWHRHLAWIEVFSSAQITKSSSPSGVPSNCRWYRSSTRPALASKSGSRGKSQLRKVHGRMASADSHRQMVVSEIWATIPEAMASARRYGTNHRDRGRSSFEGSSQARALTATTTSGGKDRRASRPGPLLQPRKAVLEEPLAPLGHHLPAGVQAGGDLVVVQAPGRQQDDLGPEHVPIRQRIFPGRSLQHGAFLRAGIENVWALPGHGSHLPLGGNCTLHQARNYVLVIRESCTKRSSQRRR